MYVSSKLTWFAILGLGAGLATGCSLKQADEHTIRIQIGSSGASVSGQNTLRVANSSAAFFTMEPTPVSINEFDCYALNISAADIPEHSKMNGNCPADPLKPRISIFVGTVSAVGDGGVIEALVPSGSDRVFTLIGAKSKLGYCPKIEDMMAEGEAMAGGTGTGGALGNPYILGQTTQDIDSDAIVDIYATWNPAEVDSRRLCIGGDRGGGGGFSGTPPTAMYAGRYDMMVSPPPGALPNAFGVTAPSSPSAAVGAPELIGALAMPTADLDKVSSFFGNYSGISPKYDVAGTSFAYHETAGISAPTGRRAVIQLQWDVTGLDRIGKPYVHMEVQFSGGGIDASGNDCVTPVYGNTRSAVAHVGIMGILLGYMPYTGWLRVGEGNTNNPLGLQVSRITEGLADKFVMTRVDGRQYMAVNVESGYFSTSAACKSFVTIEGAGMNLMAAPAPLDVYPSATDAPPRFRAGGTSDSGAIRVQGGVRPFTVSIAEGAAYGYAYMDSSNSRQLVFSPPSTMPGGSTGTLLITDAVGQTTTRNFILDPPPTPVQLMLIGYAPVITSGGLYSTANPPGMTMGSAMVPSGCLEAVNFTPTATTVMDLFFEVPVTLPEARNNYRQLSLNISGVLGGVENGCAPGTPFFGTPLSTGGNGVVYQQMGNYFDALGGGYNATTPTNLSGSYITSGISNYIMQGVTILGATRDVIVVRVGGGNNPSPITSYCGRVYISDSSPTGTQLWLQ